MYTHTVHVYTYPSNVSILKHRTKICTRTVISRPA